MTALWFVAALLAVYRLTRIIVAEEGPFGLLAHVQGWAALHQRSWVGRGLGCFLCVSFWLAGGAALLLPGLVWNERVLAWGGIAGACVVLWKWLRATGLEGDS